jgi:hypothetical protein
MSAGDRTHHVLLGERDYDRARQDPRFLTFLNRGFRVSFEYDIPYLGGYSADGSVIYIDKDTPTEIRWGNRIFQVRGPNGLVLGIVTHEHWEKTSIDAWGWKYAAAHELATHAENEFARERLGIHPSDYEKLWQPVIRAAEKKLRMPNVALPPDLDRTPYVS